MDVGCKSFISIEINHRNSDNDPISILVPHVVVDGGKVKNKKRRRGIKVDEK